MVMKKTIKSNVPIVIKSSSNEKDLFRPGFRYQAGGFIFTVVEDVTQEANSQTRKILVSDGRTEIIGVSSIKKDLKEHDTEILPVDEQYVVKDKVEKKKEKPVPAEIVVPKSEVKEKDKESKK